MTHLTTDGHGPVALVTGASSGIGRATAARLRRAGFTVVGTSRRPSEHDGEDLVELDVRSDTSARSAVALVLERHGRLDVVVNNAGHAILGEAEALTADDVRDQLDTNLLGVIRVTNAALPGMRERGGGRIVNVSSLTGLVAVPFMSAYSASKFALEGYSEALRLEVSPLGISVSLVEPGFVDTPLGSHASMPRAGLRPYDTARANALEVISSSLRAGIPATDVADAIARAASDPRPRLRYRVGRDAVRLSRLRRLVPAARFEAGTRKMFRLDDRAGGATAAG